MLEASGSMPDSGTRAIQRERSDALILKAMLL